MAVTITPCSHLEAAAQRTHAVRPSSEGCAECLASGSTWVHLRLCLTCGHVGCCDDSPNQHASKHFAKKRHPVIRSYEPGEDWGYCYLDEAFIQEIPAVGSEAAGRHVAPRAR